jgi:nucleoid-associated protein YejK
MNKIEVSRSYSKKVQIKQFEPIDAFCAAKAEVDKKDMIKISKELFEFCRNQVEKDIDDIVNERALAKERYDNAKEVAETEINNEQ